MSVEEDNKALVRRFGQAWSAGNAAVVDELADPALAVDYPALGEVKHGPEAFKEVLAQWYAGIPDSQRVDGVEVAEGGRVAVSWTVRGTHRGELWGVPATDRQITMRGVSIYRVAAGKIVAEEGVGDALGLMQQLGAIPGPG